MDTARTCQVILAKASSATIAAFDMHFFTMKKRLWQALSPNSCDRYHTPW
jgi:hypothetical protein